LAIGLTGSSSLKTSAKVWKEWIIMRGLRGWQQQLALLMQNSRSFIDLAKNDFVQE
jgi:hypothetical protein